MWFLMTSENIYRILINFERLYAIMDEAERRKLMEALIAEIQIHEEAKPNGQWLKSIRFKLPIIDEDMSLSLDNDSHIETVALLSKPQPSPTSLDKDSRAETIALLSQEK